MKDCSARQQILQVLSNSKKYARGDLLKALHDLRYNTGDGDEAILFQLLDHDDDGVVASALFTLWHAYDQQQLVESRVRKFAWGDDRDSGEMPIQSMAISLLAEIAKSDATAHEQLRLIAEDEAVGDVPRKNAWQALAEIHGIDWLRDYSVEMITSPESDTSERIRETIRLAIRSA